MKGSAAQKIAATALLALLTAAPVYAQRVEHLKYGDFNHWVTRNIKESAVIGGNQKTLYEVGPTATISGNKAYIPQGGTPWATSNVYAKVKGVVKGSNAVYPADRGGGNKCAKLCTQIERVKVLGLINMDVMVAGSMFLGRMFEPITSTSNPYSKMEMGVPYTRRPKALTLDYKVDMPAANTRTKASGLGSKKTLPGRDAAVVFVFLQRRWEDAQGNIHAKRVATAGQKFTKGTGWVNGARIPLHYGDASDMGSFVALRSGKNAYYARNSKGKMVPVNEEGWDSPNAIPTHVVVMISAGSGEPYVGTEGLTFYADNVGFSF